MVYKGDEYTDAAPLEYYMSGKDPAPIHEDTRKLLEKLLRMLATKGQKKTFWYIRKRIL